MERVVVAIKDCARRQLIRALQVVDCFLDIRPRGVLDEYSPTEISKGESPGHQSVGPKCAAAMRSYISRRVRRMCLGITCFADGHRGAEALLDCVGQAAFIDGTLDEAGALHNDEALAFGDFGVGAFVGSGPFFDADGDFDCVA